MITFSKHVGEKRFAAVPESTAKAKLMQFLKARKLFELTVENLDFWGYSWSTASSERLRACAGDAFFHHMRFVNDGKQKNGEENEFFKTITQICELCCPKAYDNQVRTSCRRQFNHENR